MRQRLHWLRQALPDILGKRAGDLSPRMIRILEDLALDWRHLDARIDALTAEIGTLSREAEGCRRIMTIPGIGPIISSAVVAAIGSGSSFMRGRDFAAWLSLLPRQMSTGDRTILGRITKRGNGYLRMLFMQAARQALGVRPCPSSAISRSDISCCFSSSRATPGLSPGTRSRSSTRASSSRFLASVFCASVSSGLRGASNSLCRSALSRFQSGHFGPAGLILGSLLDATVKLITATVREMARDPKVGRAEALRRSMLALIDKGESHEAHPAYWAPFVVVGEGGTDAAVTTGATTVTNMKKVPTAAKNQKPAPRPQEDWRVEILR